MKPIARRALLAVLLLVSASMHPACAELQEAFQRWNQPVEPFRIAGNLYYVGTNELAAYLFQSPEGHILLDGGFEESAPLVRQSIEALGLSLSDVKVLLNSHAHSDHAGGLALLAEWTGAALIASRFDAPLLEAGGEEPYRFPAVSPDRLIDDGDTVEIGGTVLTARVTAGHTPGCTTWTTTMDVDVRSGRSCSSAASMLCPKWTFYRRIRPTPGAESGHSSARSTCSKSCRARCFSGLMRRSFS
jgi:metallo-beta-lactamase class B